MNEILVGVLSALLSTNQVVVSNWLRVTAAETRKAQAADAVNPAYMDLKRVMEMDDKARGEVDALLEQREAQAARAPELKPLSTDTLVEGKLAPVRQAYEDLVSKHPTYAKARIAYGSFLNEMGDSEAAAIQWKKGNELDPKDPAGWNNLGDLYGHSGPVTNAFVCYAKAIELAPGESNYYRNLATVMYVFRDDASKFLKTNTLGVLDQSMTFYRKALELDPDNFLLAADLAQSYYGFPTPRSNDPQADRKVILNRSLLALGAWTNAMQIARDDIERQGVQIHMARWTMNVGRYAASRAALNTVTNTMFDKTKDALLKKLARLESGDPSTSAPPVSVAPPAPSKP